jgi:hypothetical protein
LALHDISNKDLAMVYLSPSHYRNAFEEVLDLRKFQISHSPTAGLECQEKNGKLFLRNMTPSTPGAKIRAWRSRLRDARLIQVNDTVVSTIKDLTNAIAQLSSDNAKSCTLLLAHSELRDGLVETGIPQINVDQLHRRYDFQDIFTMSQEEFDAWFAKLPRWFYDVVDAGGV